MVLISLDSTKAYICLVGSIIMRGIRDSSVQPSPNAPSALLARRVPRSLATPCSILVPATIAFAALSGLASIMDYAGITDLFLDASGDARANTSEVCVPPKPDEPEPEPAGEKGDWEEKDSFRNSKDCWMHVPYSASTHEVRTCTLSND